MPVKERPILFSGPMVRALLDGRKTQTRRVAKTFAPVEFNSHDDREYVLWHAAKAVARVPARNPHEEADLRMACPYGEPGDRLWVRETWQAWNVTNTEYNECEPLTPEVRSGLTWAEYVESCGKPDSIEYRATSKSVGPWTPSIHMPRWASRLTLEVTGVRVERVQSITSSDARAEGIESEGDYPETGNPLPFPVALFKGLWTDINGRGSDRSWDANPWVWVIGFEVVR